MNFYRDPVSAGYFDAAPDRHLDCRLVGGARQVPTISSNTFPQYPSSAPVPWKVYSRLAKSGALTSSRGPFRARKTSQSNFKTSPQLLQTVGSPQERRVP